MIKTIELFAGIGAQHKALINLRIDFKVVAISEWDVNAIISYDALHTMDGVDYSFKLSKKEILKELDSFTFTTNGKIPCDKSKIKTQQLRQLYNANKRSHNMGDITKINEVPIANLWTYSFPCTDISVAGKQEGFSKYSGTRSGLLWEIERLLEISQSKNELPEYLLLENVKNLVGKQFKSSFEDWLKRLNEFGYNTYWQIINSKNMGIPQNRERVFAVSIRKDVDDKQFKFPKSFDNGLRLKDFVESNVDEKYYISKDKTEKLLKQLKDKQYTNTTKTDVLLDNNQIIIPCLTPDRIKKRQNGRRFKQNGDSMFTITSQDRHGILLNECKCVGKLNNINGHDYLKRVYSIYGCSPTITTVTGGNQHIKILDNFYTKENKDYMIFEELQYRIRKLTPKECLKLMGFSEEDYEKIKNTNISDSQIYKQAGNSIVVTCLMGLFGELFNGKYKDAMTDIRKFYEVR